MASDFSVSAGFEKKLLSGLCTNFISKAVRSPDSISRSDSHAAQSEGIVPSSGVPGLVCSSAS